MHTHCLSCHRALRTEASQRRGYGPKCARRLRVAAVELTEYSADQIAAAVELIEDIAILAIQPRVFRTVSSDGSEMHLTAPHACTCPAGLRHRGDRTRRRCYHTAAARILLTR